MTPNKAAKVADAIRTLIDRMISDSKCDSDDSCAGMGSYRAEQALEKALCSEDDED